MVGVVLKVILFTPDHLSPLTASSAQLSDLSQDLLLFAVSHLAQQWFDPLGEHGLAFAMHCSAQIPEVLAAMVEVQ